MFLAIDEDGSMTLSQNEMRLTPEGFKQLAGDDGVVDGEEFIATDVASFDAIDKNKDHQIALAELVELYRELFELGHAAQRPLQERQRQVHPVVDIGMVVGELLIDMGMPSRSRMRCSRRDP